MNNVTILYVDDEPTNLLLFELNFRKNYNILTAESGNEGLEKLNGNDDIIIVISDMKMPGMNGLEFIERAKQKHKSIAYFILTGFDISNDIRKALDSNLIVAYFSKPMDKEKIDAAITTFVQSIKQ